MQASVGAKAGDQRRKLSLGPILFHWPAEKKRDFYFAVADEAPVDTVYIGEVVCSKRAPFFERYYPDVIERLTRAGKTVVVSSLAEVMTRREREMTAAMAAISTVEVEVNDVSALYFLRKKPHRIGPYVNVYNERTLSHLAEQGATHFCLPPEVDEPVISMLAEAALSAGAGIEVSIYGRVGLALSARCYHARAHGRVKDNCQYVCEAEPDSMVISTLDGTPFLAVNGVQTLSYRCLNMAQEVPTLLEMGVDTFRLSPHSHDMRPVIDAFRELLDGRISARNALALMNEASLLDAPFSNGFYHGTEGHQWIETIRVTG